MTTWDELKALPSAKPVPKHMKPIRRGPPGCKGEKVCFPTKKKANLALRRIRRNGGPEMHSYRCNDCRAFHVGHHTKDHRRKGKR